jgi:hypothetical protein
LDWQERPKTWKGQDPFLAGHPMEKTSDEILKREAVLAHIDHILAKSRTDE